MALGTIGIPGKAPACRKRESAVQLKQECLQSRLCKDLSRELYYEERCQP